MKFREKLEKIGIDYREIIIRFNGNEDLISKYLIMFSNESNIRRLSAYFEQKNYPNFLVCLDSLYGITSTLCLSELDNIIGGIISVIKEESFGELPNLYYLLIKEYCRICDLINHFFPID